MPKIDSLPQEIMGEWIWLKDCVDSLDSHIYFRREFNLEDTPEMADLWITAKTYFQVYVNGRKLGFGPPAAPNQNAHVIHYDINYMLEPGRNVIAVLAHNTTVARYAGCRSEGGFWCQLNIDNKVKLWTDKQWHCLKGDCYLGNRPRHSASTAFTEYLDMRYMPISWYEKDFNSIHWRHPDYFISLGKAKGRLIAPKVVACELTKKDFLSTGGRGSWERVYTANQISFCKLVGERGGGVYAAESYIFSLTNQKIQMNLYSDNPYRLFLNNILVQEQGIVAMHPESDIEQCKPRCFQQERCVEPKIYVELRAGWNHILYCQQVEPGCAATVMVSLDLPTDTVHFYRKPENKKLRGWSLMGPLRTPLVHITGNMNVETIPKVPFVSDINKFDDISAFYITTTFKCENDSPILPQDIHLKEKEYIILDLETTAFGCPEMLVSGSDGDIIDIFYGEQIVNNRLQPFYNDTRNVDTMILGHKISTWSSCCPRGMRYMLISVRKAKADVLIQECGVSVREFSYEHEGYLDCSDELLNNIWQVGCETMRACMQGLFFDSPTKENIQYITDSMVQSHIAGYSFGAYKMIAKSIKEFAETQYETGEMPAMTPSDYYLNMLDYTLLWPVWLKNYYMLTGDKEFLKEMLPVMEKIFSYFDYIAHPESGLLGNNEETWGTVCFLDHGNIDRRGVVTGLNAIYCRSLLCGAWLYQQIPQTRLATTLTRKANRVADRLRRLVWNPKDKTIADCWCDGKPSEKHSWQTSVLAIFGGILPEPEDYDTIFERLITDKQPYVKFPPSETNNPLFNYFLLEAAFALQKRTWAMKYIRWYWGEMLKRGAVSWWELFEPRYPSSEIVECSLCNGSGASPNIFFLRELAGIRPATPGFSSIYFNPLPEIVNKLSARVPTPKGSISVKWELKKDGDFEVEMSATFPLEVVLILSPNIAENAILHVGEEITILAETKSDDDFLDDDSIDEQFLEEQFSDELINDFEDDENEIIIGDAPADNKKAKKKKKKNKKRLTKKKN